jgi:hypothetical protein
MDPLDYGTLYQSLKRTTNRWGSRVAYGASDVRTKALDPFACAAMRESQ